MTSDIFDLLFQWPFRHLRPTPSGGIAVPGPGGIDLTGHRRHPRLNQLNLGYQGDNGDMQTFVSRVDMADNLYI